MDPEPPALAVVIASRNRRSLLRRAISAVAEQEGVPNIEVVVVDDASTDGTDSMLERLHVDGTGTLRTIRLPARRGPAAARNIGWRSASSPLVAFTDDDCVPAPGWAAALVAGLASSDMVQGKTEPHPDQVHRVGPFSHTMAISAPSGFYETCNMGYRRTVLERVGGFDEAFRQPYGEDADLGWRARDRGATFAFVPDAVVHHEVFASRVRDRLRTIPRLEGVVQVVAAHPELRGSLERGLFFRRSHLPAMAAAAGLGLLAARRASARAVPAAALLLTPYLWHRLAREPLCNEPRANLRAIPAGLLLDLAQVSVLAQASLRHRTLVL